MMRAASESIPRRSVGQTLGLSLPRRLVIDLLHASRDVPLVPIERRMQLSPLVAARQACRPRPSWCSIFTKAWAFVAVREAVFRRAYLSFPWPRLYEHPGNVAAVAVECRWGDEDAVFFTHLREPERLPLARIDEALRRCKERPFEGSGSVRRAVRVGRLPRPARRLLWWGGLNVSGAQRARHFGTFGVSVTAGLGAAVLAIRSPLTTTLYYGVFDRDGGVDVRLAFDHRVLDGATAARALVEMERVLLTEMVAELAAGGQGNAAA
jgi:hypothetical protein